jgi:hypothetical protein
VPPIPGAEGFLSSYVVAFRFFQRAKEVIGVGYNTDPTGIFRFPRLFRWDYVANGHQRVLEVSNAPKNVLSVEESMADVRVVWFGSILGVDNIGFFGRWCKRTTSLAQNRV